MADTKIWDGSKWVSLMGPQGPQGDPGKDGSGVTIKGTATAYPPDASPAVGDMWIVGDPVPAGSPPGTAAGDGLVWTGTGWENVGGIRGPAGPKGDPGEKGDPGVDGVAGADGPAGADGVGFRFVGELDGGEPLENNDVVTFDGCTYLVTGVPVARTFTPPAGRGGMPTIPLPGGGELVLMAARGDDGSAGADGVAGADGKSVAVYVQASQPASPNAGDFWIEP